MLEMYAKKQPRELFLVFFLTCLDLDVDANSYPKLELLVRCRNDLQGLEKYCHVSFLGVAQLASSRLCIFFLACT